MWGDPVFCPQGLFSSMAPALPYWPAIPICPLRSLHCLLWTVTDHKLIAKFVQIILTVSAELGAFSQNQEVTSKGSSREATGGVICITVPEHYKGILLWSYWDTSWWYLWEAVLVPAIESPLNRTVGWEAVHNLCHVWAVLIVHVCVYICVHVHWVLKGRVVCAKCPKLKTFLFS